MSKIKNRAAGQSLFELLVALAVTVLIVTGIVKIVTLSVANSTFAKNQSAATRFGQEAFEWLRGEKDKDWEAFSNRSDVSWCLPTIAWPSQPGPCSADNKIAGTPFTREASLSTLEVGKIQVLVRVSWEDSRGEHSSRTDTVFTNWRGTP
ncbi:MAG: hypothetical protein Q7S60_05265 [bacterium]|nr:hypothetical protein [bacterium]